MKVKRGKQRTTEGSTTPSKGGRSEKEKKGGKKEGRRKGVMNALTVTTSSIKQPHYTLISAHTRENMHTRRYKHTHTHTAVDPNHFRGH